MYCPVSLTTRIHFRGAKRLGADQDFAITPAYRKKGSANRCLYFQYMTVISVEVLAYRH
jgi:hypothetical protein